MHIIINAKQGISSFYVYAIMICGTKWNKKLNGDTYVLLPRNGIS